MRAVQSGGCGGCWVAPGLGTAGNPLDITKRLGGRWVSHCTSFVAGLAPMHPQTLCGALASQALQEDCPGAGLKLCWSHPLPFGPAGLHPAKAWHKRTLGCVFGRLRET